MRLQYPNYSKAVQDTGTKDSIKMLNAHTHNELKNLFAVNRQIMLRDITDDLSA